MEGIRIASGEELKHVGLMSGSTASQVGSKPQGSLATEKTSNDRQAFSFMEHKIGTWNVRSMQQGKLEIVKQEIEWVHRTILGSSELRWIGMGFFLSDNVKVFYSGHDSHRKMVWLFSVLKKLQTPFLDITQSQRESFLFD